MMLGSSLENVCLRIVSFVEIKILNFILSFCIHFKKILEKSSFVNINLSDCKKRKSKNFVNFDDFAN